MVDWAAKLIANGNEHHEIARHNQQQLKLFDNLPEQRSESWQPIRDDFNFCRLALFVPGDKRADRFRDLKFSYTVEVGGRKFDATWEVRHDRVSGLPGTFDRDVWYGILARIRFLTQGGRLPIPERIELGSAKEFLRFIGKPQNGRYIAMFKEAVRRLARTSCFAERAYNCPTDGGYLRVLENMSLM